MRFFKWNFSAHSCLRILAATWLESLCWSPFHKWSPSFWWTWTRLNFSQHKGLPYCTAGYETWFMEATLIEIGVYQFDCSVLIHFPIESSINKSTIAKSTSCFIFLFDILKTTKLMKKIWRRPWWVYFSGDLVL